MENVQEIVAKAGDLPALSQVAARVLELIHDPKTRTQDLEDSISKDPALTARVLRIANSAFYGVRGTVSTLRRGIVVLGFNTLRSVVLAGSAARIYKGGAGSAFKDMILWEHALAVAIAARELANEVQPHFAEEAFVGGLLHDIGKGVLDRNLDGGYEKVIEMVYNEDGTRFVDAERELLGYDHAEVGAAVVEKWGLAPEMVEAVRLHHRPEQANAEPQLCCMVSLANSLCVKLSIGPERIPELDLEWVEARRRLGVNVATLEQLGETVRTMLREEKGLLNV